jgi:alpha-L-rhamnosidase
MNTGTNVARETGDYMQYKILLRLALGVTLVVWALLGMGQESAGQFGPAGLEVDNLKNPLGIDDGVPRFSWQLRDSARGAKQTAFEVEVAATAAQLNAGQADVWDSGRVETDQSLNVVYRGPALVANTRYWWRVKVWGKSGGAYKPSATVWWETGLMNQNAWSGEWIGFETPEEATVRAANAAWIESPEATELTEEKELVQRFAYRGTVTLAKPVRFAALYSTGQDTVAAWVNGLQVLTADTLPPWRQMPWKKYVRVEVGGKLNAGTNTLAIESMHYVEDTNESINEAAPMIATLVVEYADGSWESFRSGPDWKTAIHPAEGWTSNKFDDSEWKCAIAVDDGAEHFGNPWIADSVKALRHQFQTGGPVKSARLYATALGAYEMFLNGRRVGDQMLAPGWTDYRERVYYQTYDVTGLIAQGKNAIEALLAPGWYEDPIGGTQQPNNYGTTPPALRAQLRIEFLNGRVEWVSTDRNWQASTSGILHSENYDGETVDARLWVPGGFSRKLDQSAWRPVEVIQPKPVRIEAQDFQPIRVERALRAVSLTEPKPGVWVYDFGQNFSGVERVRVNGPAGATARMRFAEVLNPDGTIYTDNLRTAKATDYFTLSGTGIEEFTPQFTFHGFRYAELTGLPGAPRKDAVLGLVLHTDAPFTAKLDTGSAMVNQLWRNILWGQRSNFIGLPTDCPQRDERLGWMGDAEVFWRAASYNMGLAAFSRKFAADMRGTQEGTPYYGIYSPGTASESTVHAAGWSDAGVIVPWTSWIQTGDRSVINENWSAMTKYLDAIEGSNPDGLWKNDAGIPLGDWLSPEGKTNYLLIATAYWAYDVTLMREMALATGRNEDAQKYDKLFAKIRAAFVTKFLRADGFVAGVDNPTTESEQIDDPDAMSSGGDTQTGYVLALHMNLVPENLRTAAAKHLVEKIEANHDLLGTGFLGTPYLLEELTKAGDADLAYKLLENTQYPSWGYMVTHGATTMWERWNGDQMRGDPSMNSYNHYAYGAVADWIYRYAAGVDATQIDPGFHTVVLHPAFNPTLGHLSFDYKSVLGNIHSAWTVKGMTAQWRLTLPANTMAWLPLSDAEAEKFKLEGQRLSQSRFAKPGTRDGQSGFELESGDYHFSIELER